jgi:hypothetical protein
MDQVDYRARFHQALAKAFAAQSIEVRTAYFDLASYYRDKIEGPCDSYPISGGYRSWVAA